MRRLTTPTHTFTIVGIDVTLIKRIKVTYAQGCKVVLEKRDDEIKIDGNKAVVKLTQEETAKFTMGKEVCIQLRVLTHGGDSFATAIKTAPLLDVLDEEVLE